MNLSAARYLGAVMVAVVGVVHLQQYVSFIKDVPTIGPLFLLNAAGAGAIVVMLAVARIRTVAALGGLALCAGSLVSIAVSASSSGLFGYSEPTLRGPVAVAVVAELLGLLILASFVLQRRRVAA